MFNGIRLESVKECWRKLTPVILIAGTGALLLAFVVRGRSRDEFNVDDVIRTEVPGMREDVHVRLTSRSGKSFLITPTVEVWNGEQWQSTSVQYAEFAESFVRVTGMLSIRVPGEGKRWRIKLMSDEVDPNEYEHSHCFNDGPFLKRLAGYCGLSGVFRRRAVQYLDVPE
jgi:hypothetical protein